MLGGGLQKAVLEFLLKDHQPWHRAVDESIKKYRGDLGDGDLWETIIKPRVVEAGGELETKRDPSDRDDLKAERAYLRRFALHLVDEEFKPTELDPPPGWPDA